MSRVVAGALVAVTVALLGAWLVLAGVHVGDRYRVGHPQGTWMALAAHANDGVLYPPLFDGERYGGTRYMPVQIVLNAAAARVTGEYLVSGKAVAAVLAVVLVVLVAVVLLRSGCRPPLAWALAALVLATWPGLVAGTTVGGDALPVVLQVAALGLLATRPRAGPAALGVAGALCGLAFAAKLSAVWAAAAVAVWLLAAGRRQDLLVFLAALGTLVGVLLGAAQVASGGRMGEALTLLALAGSGDPTRIARAVTAFLHNVYEHAPAMWFLLPFAVAGSLGLWARRDLPVWHLALGFAGLVTLVMHADVGVGLNQLLDLVVVGVIAVGVAGAARPGLHLVLCVAVVWVGLTALGTFLQREVREAAAVARGDVPEHLEPHPLRDVVGQEDTLLSESPYVPVSLGRRPVVLDAFMLLRLAEARPDLEADLVARIRSHEFDHVAMIQDIGPHNDWWWSEYHFGLTVVGALRESYRLVGEVDGYVLYAPR